MQLSRDEEKSLSGDNGPVLATAYRILAAIGEAIEAERLVPIQWAHVSGVNYNTIGDSGVEFLEEFSMGSKAVVRTTVNPMGYDRQKPDGISDSFRQNQERIVASYERLGVVPSFTCTPYEVFEIPARGTQVSFAESNAAVFSNSMLGLRTNKESALSALASSVTGKTPLSDLRIERLRQPRFEIEAGFKLATDLDYGLLGYFAGKTVKDGSSVSFSKVQEPSVSQAKSLSAGIGTSGSCGMFVMGQNANEKITFDRREQEKMIDELNTSESGDIIALGSPQFGLSEMKKLAQYTAGKKFKKRCLIFCSTAIHQQAIKIGLAGELERSGAEVMCDSCTCLTPYVTKEKYDSVITNGVKGAYYFKHSSRLGVSLKDIKTISEEYMA